MLWIFEWMESGWEWIGTARDHQAVLEFASLCNSQGRAVEIIGW